MREGQGAQKAILVENSIAVFNGYLYLAPAIFVKASNDHEPF